MRSDGTPCTQENFDEWKRKFDEEMNVKEGNDEVQKEKDVMKDRKTGYDVFRDKIGGNIDPSLLEGDEGGDEDVMDFDESLYLEGSDEDLDDMDFDDDEEEEEEDEDDVDV